MWLQNWVMARTQKSFEAHDTKSLGCLEEIVGRNMDIKGDFGRVSEGSEKDSRGILCHLREYIYCHEQNFARNNEH